MTTTSPPMPPGSLAATGVAAARVAASREPGLVAVGLGGIVLAVMCLAGVLAGVRVVSPEGDLWGAATFDVCVALFTLTIAALLPLAGYAPAPRRRWRRAFYIYVVYGLVVETVQAFRGLDPRFTEAGDDADVAAGIVFGATAGLNSVLFAVLAVRFFRADVLADRPVLRVGIRYGATAVAISFAVGVAMSIAKGRQIGEEGNLIVTHGLGVHGLQAIPLVALVVSRSGVPRPAARVHVAGAAWLVACAAALAQALLGRPPLDASLLSIVVVAGLGVWATVAAGAVRSWRKGATRQG